MLVLGHTRCGAIQATIDEILQPAEGQSRNVLSVVNRIRPAIATLVQEHRDDPSPALTDIAVQANVRACISELLAGSDIMRDLVAQGRVKVIGAEYHLEHGRVEVIDKP